MLMSMAIKGILFVFWFACCFHPDVFLFLERTVEFLLSVDDILNIYIFFEYY